MADYGLKYYKTFRSMQTAGSNVFRMEIWQKGLDASYKALEIGDWQGLSLEIDGDDDPVSPIQKTIVTFSMVDSSDKQDTETVKYGNWNEFYTPDSTLYKVVIRKGEDGNAIWSGYITPDNWQESLGYRGTITVTARDNIGHLQDFDFDLEPDNTGTVTVKAIISTAMARIEFPMTYDIMLTTIDNSDYSGIIYDETGLANFRINASLFSGKTWYEVLESVLTSLGLSFRYVGASRFVLTYLRYLPLLGEQGRPALAEMPVMFVSEGTRTLTPPYRKVITTVDFKTESELEYDPLEGLDLSGTETYDFRVRNLSGSSEGFQYLEGSGSYALNRNSSAAGWQPAGAYFNATGYKSPSELSYGAVSVYDEKTTVLLAANRKSGTFTHTYGFGLVHIPSGKISVKIDKNFYGVDEGKKIIASISSYLASVSYSIKYVSGGVSYYWDGGKWTKTVSVLSAEYTEGMESLEFDFSNQNGNSQEIEPDGELYLAIDGITFNTGFFGYAEYRLEKYTGIYMGVKGISLQMPESSKSLDSDTVTTVNDDTYNINYDEDLDLGFLSREVGWQTPGNYVNAIYYIDGDRIVVPAGYDMGWDGDTLIEPFPAILHRQILTYHHSPMQLLEGDCMPAAGASWEFNRTITYKGHSFLLQGGTYDFVSGVMSGARLVEFVFYDDLWAATYTVRLLTAGSNKLAVVKAISQSSGIPLRTAKLIVDSAPADIGKGYTAAQAENIQAAIEAAGGTASIAED